MGWVVRDRLGLPCKDVIVTNGMWVRPCEVMIVRNGILGQAGVAVQGYECKDGMCGRCGARISF